MIGDFEGQTYSYLKWYEIHDSQNGFVQERYFITNVIEIFEEVMKRLE